MYSRSSPRSVKFSGHGWTVITRLSIDGLRVGEFL